jgi:CHASE2 domain-containing sensor protein
LRSGERAGAGGEGESHRLPSQDDPEPRPEGEVWPGRIYWWLLPGVFLLVFIETLGLCLWAGSSPVLGLTIAVLIIGACASSALALLLPARFFPPLPPDPGKA